MRTFRALTAALLLGMLCISSAQAALIQFDLRGPAANLGHSTTFDGPEGVSLSVSAFTSDPSTMDTIRQTGSGIGTRAGNRSQLDNSDSDFFGQFLSFRANGGSIRGIEFTGFGRSETLLLIASDVNGIPMDNSQFTVIDRIFGVAGNPDQFALPDIERPFLHVLSTLADPMTRVRVSGITVDTTAVPNPGSLMLLSLGLLSFANLRRRAGNRNLLRC